MYVQSAETMGTLELAANYRTNVQERLTTLVERWHARR